jgi:uncharacterized protein
VHAVDEAMLQRQPGVPVSQHLVALLTVTAGGFAAAFLFPRLRAGLQSVVAVTAGAVTTTNGAMHVLHVIASDGDARDLTGVLAAAAGASLLTLGIVVPWLRRGEHRSSRTRTWGKRAVVVAAATVTIPLVLVPLCVGLVQSHVYRKPVGPLPGTDYRDVWFGSSDGLRISGWYHPSQNRAAILLVPSAGGHRTGTLAHARMLAAHGYGVLLYDARGAGRSDGTPNGWGWTWDRDVAGAIAFLRRQPDVAPARLGALGLSTGADVLIEVAAEQRGSLAAIVADGATARSFADSVQGPLDAPFVWTMMSSGRLFSGMEPGRPLETLIREAAPTSMLLVAGESIPQERPFNRRYARAGGPTVELWQPRGVDHTAGIVQAVAEYERRVLRLFDKELLR